MADAKISALAAKATPASADLLVLVDVSDTTMAPSGTNKQATVAQLAASVSTALNLGTAAVHPATDFAPAAVLESMVTGLVADLAGKATAAQGTKADTAVQPAGLAAFAGSTSIITVGTIASGTWHGSAIGVTYLGTGTPAAGKYLDGAGAWTSLPASATYTTFVGSGASHAGGLVPDPGATAGTTRFLREDATFAVPPAGASTSSPNEWTAQQIFDTGASGGSPAVFRQTGGAAGVKEVQVYHDGTNGRVSSKSGSLGLNGTATVVSSDGNVIGVPFVNCTSQVGVGSGAGGGTYAIAIGASATTVAGGYSIGFTALSNAGAGGVDVAISRASAGLIQVNNASTGPGGLSSPANTPAQIAASTNNYAPGVGLWQRWNASTPVNVTGMVAGQAGERRTIANVGSSTITLTNQDAASTAANRWLTTTGADIALAANRMAWAIYDATTAAWRVSLLP